MQLRKSSNLNVRQCFRKLLREQTEGTAEERASLNSLRVVAGTQGPQTADVEILIDGTVRSASAQGNGPVDAIFKAITEIMQHSAKLELFQVHAVTGGADAQATVSVRLSEDGLVATARSSDPDTLTATARAYIHALCKLDIRRAKRIAA